MYHLRQLWTKKSVFLSNFFSGSYQCIPPDGFVYNAELNECIDVDECETENPCGEENKCKNKAGGYTCECRPGFTKTQDNDGKDLCVDNRPGTCFAHVTNGQCSDPVDEALSRSDCCCLQTFSQSIGQCFATINAEVIDNCPTVGSDAYGLLCGQNKDDQEMDPDLIPRICRVKGRFTIFDIR